MRVYFLATFRIATLNRVNLLLDINDRDANASFCFCIVWEVAVHRVPLDSDARLSFLYCGFCHNISSFERPFSVCFYNAFVFPVLPVKT